MKRKGGLTRKLTAARADKAAMELLVREREREQSMLAVPIDLEVEWELAFVRRLAEAGGLAWSERGPVQVLDPRKARLLRQGDEIMRRVASGTNAILSGAQPGSLARHLASANLTAASATKLGDRNSLHWSGVVLDEMGRPRLGIVPKVAAQVALAKWRAGFKCTIEQARHHVMRSAARYGSPDLDWYGDRGNPVFRWKEDGTWLSRQSRRKREGDWQAAVIVDLDHWMQADYRRCRSDDERVVYLDLLMAHVTADPPMATRRAGAA